MELRSWVRTAKVVLLLLIFLMVNSRYNNGDVTMRDFAMNGFLSFVLGLVEHVGSTRRASKRATDE